MRSRRPAVSSWPLATLSRMTRIEDPRRLELTAEPGVERSAIDRAAAERAAAELLVALGAELVGEQPRETPRRMVDADAELLTPEPFRATTFANQRGHDELVLVRSIPFDSLRLHHLLPFRGVAPVGYLPGRLIVGHSKLARVVELFARDVQLQERLTMRIADWVHEQLGRESGGVELEAEHPCMSLRGVQKFDAKTVASALQDLVRNDPRTGQELLAVTTGSAS